MIKVRTTNPEVRSNKVFVSMFAVAKFILETLAKEKEAIIEAHDTKSGGYFKLLWDGGMATFKSANSDGYDMYADFAEAKRELTKGGWTPH